MKKCYFLIALAVIATFNCLVVNAQNQFTYDFENDLQGWITFNVIDSGGTWIHSSNNPCGYDYTGLAHLGTGFAMCYSYVDYDGAYNTDSYLISPQKYILNENSALTFWADNANDEYPEAFSVAISTAETLTAAADFITIWSGQAKIEPNAKYENWREHTIDLSEYAGQSVWVVFHDVNYDAYEIWIDDVTITVADGGVSGISENDTQMFNVYPNPANDILNVKADNVKQIEILNMLGQNVISTNMHTIDISNLTNGVYFVRINFNNGQSSTQKFVKE